MTERIKIPHPHAVLMMEYAKDCLTDSEAWRGVTDENVKGSE